MNWKTVLLAFYCALHGAAAQEKATIRVDAAADGGPWKAIWACFGYDEPNYTYMSHGRKLLHELSELSPVPVYIRTHHLLTSGDGKPALKWGSTNAYTEDAAGKPVYNWTILDRIFDAYRDERLRPLVEIGFMPKALSVNPEPYQPTWPRRGANGWSYPPKDYASWAELVYRWVRHSAERYGEKEVEGWYWEVWNEPDIGAWRATPSEYYKLYDFAADAVKRALPGARIGGPHSTGPASPPAAEFLRGFLDHTMNGKNHVTGKTGSPLDFIAFHAKGATKMVDGRVHMDIGKQANDIARGFEIVASFPQARGKPVIIGESDPEGCAACSARTHPQNAYRNGPLYASYTAAMFRHTLDLAKREGINIAGAVTWAFEFEDQPWFDGLRTLATNGVDKPILNVFRMLGLMGGRRLAVEADSAVDLETVLRSGVWANPDINALASRDKREISVLIWNYHDIDMPSPAAQVDLIVSSIPLTEKPIRIQHYRIDERHSNAYTKWKEMGSPQRPSAEQYDELEASGKLQLFGLPQWVRADDGTAHLSFTLPRQGVSLIQLAW